MYYIRLLLYDIFTVSLRGYKIIGVCQIMAVFREIPWHVSFKLGIHIRVCGYVMHFAAYDFCVFEYHA